MYSLSNTLEFLKDRIYARWSDLRFVEFELSFYMNGQTKIIDSQLDLQSIASLLIMTSSPCFEITIGNVGTSSSISNNPIPICVAPPTVPSLSLSNSTVSVSSLNTKDWGILFKEIGQRFDGGSEEFRIALKKYSFQNGFKTIYLKNDATRVTAQCVGNGATKCTWFIHAATTPGIKKALFVKSFVNTHCCDYGCRDLTKLPLSGKLVATLVLDEVRDKHNVVPKDIQNSLRRNYGIHANYYFAHKAREIACEEIYGSHSGSYSMLPAYVDALRRTNPGSHIDLEFDVITNKFQRIFVSFEACIHGFQFVRPLIYVDGTFLKGKFKGCLLAATCLDGQGEMYPLAFAVVDSENDFNWRWFLENLKMIVSDEVVITFMSDRNHGLITYTSIVFPNSYHGYCLWHLKNNLRGALSGTGRREHIVILFERCCKAPTHELFTVAFNDFMHAVGNREKVIDFLHNLPREKWANAYFQGNRYGYVCSSLSESFNSWILLERELPITSLVDHLRLKIMRMRSNRRDKSLAWDNVLCPNILESLKETMVASRILTGDKSADMVYEVHSTQNYHVDLGRRFCSCNLWRINGVPCKHAVYCLQNSGLDINEFYECYFHADYYKKSYLHAINPIPSDVPTSSVGVASTVHAPDIKNQPGRPRKKRISSSGSLETTKKARTCSVCKEKVFHNKRTCKGVVSITQ